MTVRRLFIAGARCPACDLEDKIQLCRTDSREWIECVRCGHQEERPTEVTPKDPDPAPESHGVVRFTP